MLAINKKIGYLIMDKSKHIIATIEGPKSLKTKYDTDELTALLIYHGVISPEEGLSVAYDTSRGVIVVAGKTFLFSREIV